VTNPELDAALLLLSRLGVTPEQLAGHSRQGLLIPTFGEYIPQVSAAVPAGSRRVYETYWKRTLRAWSNRRLDEPTPLDILRLAEQAKAEIVIRRNSRGGRTAAEHMIAALRCVYRHAVQDRLISEADNPAIRVPKPRRLASTRRALPDTALAQINEVAATTGNDPELDTLLLRLHEETACRRGGALALEHADLDREHCLVRLREKGETMRWQPVSPTLARHLHAHAQQRNDGSHLKLLCYRNGRAITGRRYDYLWSRLGNHLPWVATQQVSIHWLRHTTLTWVERNFGHAIAAAYAGHSIGGQGEGATAIYTRATLEELATALTALSGEPHPLARH
jgi:integrase/recombinase XerC